MTRLIPDPASFRDPASRVFVTGDRVFRGLTSQGLADFDALERTTFFRRAMAEGHVVGTSRVSEVTLEASPGVPFQAVLEHERLPFISYPYEWSFGMLKSAALITLDLTLKGLDEGLIAKDASSYNVQFRGSHPIFIDVGTFELAQPGEPWYGYLQFCEQFLVPLMLQAYRGVDFQPILRGSPDGIRIEQAARLLTRRDTFRPGVLKHVRLHARLQRAYADPRPGASAQRDLAKAGFTPELIKNNILKLTRLVDALSWQPAGSTWSDYRGDNSYSADDLTAKTGFVERVSARRPRTCVWDLGANDGHFSLIAAQHADYVVAFDADHVTIERLHARLLSSGNRRILPLVMDLTNPSPDLGWRGQERKSMGTRAGADLVLALAFVHHLAISRSIPLTEIIRWLADLGPELVLEFPLPDDPQVVRLRQNKRQNLRLDYSLESLESALESRFHVRERITLPSGSRLLYHAERRAES